MQTCDTTRHVIDWVFVILNDMFLREMELYITLYTWAKRDVVRKGEKGMKREKEEENKRTQCKYM